MIARSFLLLAAGAFCGACHSQSATSDSAHPANMQWSGQHGGGDTPAVRALRTIDDWNAFWKQVERERPPPPDFTRQMAVVISLGEKRTGGFSAEFLGARQQDAKLIIEYREISPEPGVMVTQALTSPWTVVLVPRSDLPLHAQKSAASPSSRQEK